MADLATGATSRALELLYPPTPKYERRPTDWVHERLGEHLWSRQRDVAQSVVEHRKTAVPACHSAGKSFLAARIAAWWLSPDTHPPGSAFVVTTAPSDQQVKAILWREIGRARRAADRNGHPDAVPGRLTLDGQWKMKIGGDEELVAYGRKPQDLKNAEEAATAFQGIHARYVLVIVDEACGIPVWLWDAVDALLTNEDARALAIGNPTDAKSKFAAMCEPESTWHVERIRGWDTPNFTDEPVPEELRPMLLTPTWVEEAIKERGRDSGYVTSRVDAEFPQGDDDGTLISPDLVRAAQERDMSGSMLGDRGTLAVDVARLGGDETVFGLRRGGVFRIRRTERKQRTTQTSLQVVEERDASRALDVVVDADGIGGAVTDQLIADGHDVHEFTMTGAALQPERFFNRRAEAWWSIRELFESRGIDLDPEDKTLADQLSQVQWWERPDGRIQVESKQQMRDRGHGSPDRADTLLMACSVRRTPTRLKDQVPPDPPTLSIAGEIRKRAW